MRTPPQLVFLTLALLINDFLAPHLVLVMAMTAVLCLNLIPTNEALAGFSNEGVLTIAVLFIVAKVRSLSKSPRTTRSPRPRTWLKRAPEPDASVHGWPSPGHGDQRRAAGGH